MSQLFISDEAGEGEKKGGNKETPSSCAVGGTVAPGSICRLVSSPTEGQLNGESTTVPVDSNNNGCACSTETMCLGGVIFFNSL